MAVVVARETVTTNGYQVGPRGYLKESEPSRAIFAWMAMRRERVVRCFWLLTHHSWIVENPELGRIGFLCYKLWLQTLFSGYEEL